MSRTAIFEALLVLSGAALGPILYRRGNRIAGSFILAATILVGFFSFRSALIDLLKFAIEYQTITAIIIVVLTVFFWIYGVDFGKSESATAAAQPPTSQPGSTPSLTDIALNTIETVRGFLERHSKAIRILTFVALLLFLIPLAFSIWTFFETPSPQHTSETAIPTKKPTETPPLKKTPEEEAAAKRAADEAVARKKAEDEATAHRRTEAEAERKRAEEQAARRRADEEEAARKKTEEEATQKKAEEERQRAEREAARKKAEAEAEQRRKDGEAAAEEAARRRAEEQETLRRAIEAAKRRFRLMDNTTMSVNSQSPRIGSAVTVRNLDECILRCAREARCAGFSFFKEPDSTKLHWCNLHSARMTIYDSTSYISGVLR